MSQLRVTGRESPVLLTAAELRTLMPDAAVEEVGDRRELVVYTGFRIKRDDDGSPIGPGYGLLERIPDDED